MEGKGGEDYTIEIFVARGREGSEKVRKKEERVEDGRIFFQPLPFMHVHAHACRSGGRKRKERRKRGGEKEGISSSPLLGSKARQALQSFDQNNDCSGRW